MARRIKIPEERLLRFSGKGSKRKIDIRNKRKYYLIVCEGTKTEPNYFEALKDDLPKGVLTAYQIDIEGTGRNTRSLVTEAKRIKEAYRKQTGRPVDRLWVVFDKDSFTPNDFNSAIQQCQTSRPQIGCAWSNEAFELWYLLHFHYYNTPIDREAYQRLIEQNLSPKIGNEYRYQKNSKEMYQLLKQHGDQVAAIRNAERLVQLYDGQQNYANQNPCTMVHELIVELNNLFKNEE